MFNFLSEKKDEVVLIVDIGNGSIAGAFVCFSKGRKPKLLYTTRLPFIVSEKPHASKLLEGMYSLCNELLQNMVTESHQIKELKHLKPRSALVTFSSPWFTSKTKHVHIEKDALFTITRDFFNSVIQTEGEIFKKELKKESEQSTDVDIIEKSIVHTTINGYALNDSLGQKTKIFDAFLCLSVISHDIIEKISNSILTHTHVPKEHVLIHSFPLVSFTVLRDIFPTVTDFLIMDVTGEVTDITLVLNNVITKTVSFPSGRNFILRQIVKVFNITPEIAGSTLHLYMSGKVDDSTYNTMQEVLTEAEKEWSIYFEDTLVELNKGVTLPSKVYITADSDVAQLFINFLKISKTDATMAFRQTVDTVSITHDTLSGLYESASLVSTDEFIGILSIFYSKFIK
jgi:hypothetical protein